MAIIQYSDISWFDDDKKIRHLDFSQSEEGKWYDIADNIEAVCVNLRDCHILLRKKER